MGGGTVGGADGGAEGGGGGGGEVGGEQWPVGEERLVVDSVVLEAFPAFDTLTRPPDDGDGAVLRQFDFEAAPINRLTRFEIDLSCRDPRAAVRQATPAAPNPDPLTRTLTR